MKKQSLIILSLLASGSIHFTAQASSGAGTRITLESTANDNVSRDEFSIFYQPKSSKNIGFYMNNSESYNYNIQKESLCLSNQLSHIITDMRLQKLTWQQKYCQPVLAYCGMYKKPSEQDDTNQVDKKIIAMLKAESLNQNKTTFQVEVNKELKDKYNNDNLQNSSKKQNQHELQELYETHKELRIAVEHEHLTQETNRYKMIVGRYGVVIVGVAATAGYYWSKTQK